MGKVVMSPPTTHTHTHPHVFLLKSLTPGSVDALEA